METGGKNVRWTVGHLQAFRSWIMMMMMTMMMMTSYYF